MDAASKLLFNTDWEELRNSCFPGRKIIIPYSINKWDFSFPQIWQLRSKLKGLFENLGLFPEKYFLHSRLAVSCVGTLWRQDPLHSRMSSLGIMKSECQVQQSMELWTSWECLGRNRFIMTGENVLHSWAS